MIPDVDGVPERFFTARINTNFWFPLQTSLSVSDGILFLTPQGVEDLCEYSNYFSCLKLQSLHSIEKYGLFYFCAMASFVCFICLSVIYLTLVGCKKAYDNEQLKRHNLRYSKLKPKDRVMTEYLSFLQSLPKEYVGTLSGFFIFLDFICWKKGIIGLYPGDCVLALRHIMVFDMDQYKAICISWDCGLNKDRQKLYVASHGLTPFGREYYLSLCLPKTDLIFVNREKSQLNLNHDIIANDGHLRFVADLYAVTRRFARNYCEHIRRYGDENDIVLPENRKGKNKRGRGRNNGRKNAQNKQKVWHDYLLDKMKHDYISYEDYIDLCDKYAIEPDDYEYYGVVDDLYEDFEFAEYDDRGNFPHQYGFEERMYEYYGRPLSRKGWNDDYEVDLAERTSIYYRNRDENYDPRIDGNADHFIRHEGGKKKGGENKPKEITVRLDGEDFLNALLNGDTTKILGAIDNVKVNDYESTSDEKEVTPECRLYADTQVPCNLNCAQITHGFGPVLVPGKPANNLEWCLQGPPIVRKRRDSSPYPVVPVNPFELVSWGDIGLPVVEPTNLSSNTSRVCPKCSSRKSPKFALCEKCNKGGDNKTLIVKPEANVGGMYLPAPEDVKVKMISVFANGVDAGWAFFGSWTSDDGSKMAGLFFCKHFVSECSDLVFVNEHYRISQHEIMDGKFGFKTVFGPNGVDAAVMILNKDKMELNGLFHVSILNINPSLTAVHNHWESGYMYVKRAGKMVYSPTQRFNRLVEKRGILEYGSNSEAGDCGSPFFVEGLVVGFHCGTVDGTDWNAMICFAAPIVGGWLKHC